MSTRIRKGRKTIQRTLLVAETPSIVSAMEGDEGRKSFEGDVGSRIDAVLVLATVERGETAFAWFVSRAGRKKKKRVPFAHLAWLVDRPHRRLGPLLTLALRLSFTRDPRRRRTPEDLLRKIGWEATDADLQSLSLLTLSGLAWSHSSGERGRTERNGGGEDAKAGSCGCQAGQHGGLNAFPASPSCPHNLAAGT